MPAFDGLATLEDMCLPYVKLVDNHKRKNKILNWHVNQHICLDIITCDSRAMEAWSCKVIENQEICFCFKEVDYGWRTCEWNPSVHALQGQGIC